MQQKIISDEPSRLYALLSGIGIAYALSCTIFIGYALLLTYSKVTSESMHLVVSITGILSVFIAGYDAARGAKNRGWLWGLIAGALYAFILSIIGMWATNGNFLDARTATLFVLCIAGGGLGGVIGINKSR
ncbi:membrane protein [Clostridia bacterium]|nr:membrane protein [Clostridia bacterium]